MEVMSKCLSKMPANMRSMVIASYRGIVKIFIQLKFASNQSAMWQNVWRVILSHAGTTKQEAADSKRIASMIMSINLILMNYLGKLSFKKTTKHMEFSICWLTPLMTSPRVKRKWCNELRVQGWCICNLQWLLRLSCVQNTSRVSTRLNKIQTPTVCSQLLRTNPLITDKV